jgi:signal transduction histidine kinase
LKLFLPKSIPGQLALVMAGALLVASLVNFVLLLGERERAAFIEQSGPAIARFTDIGVDVFASPPAVGERLAILDRRQGPGGRYQIANNNPVDNLGLPRDAGLERRVRDALANAGVSVAEIRASSRVITRMSRPPQGFGPDARDRPARRDMPAPPPPAEGEGLPRMAREILLGAQLPDGRWFSSIAISPEPNGGDAMLLGISTFVTFVFVLGAALLVARQVSRPLRDLADAAVRVGAAGAPEEVPLRGHGDVRQTLEAFNTMSRRVSQLLNEKDVMLGALGHDLRTPLASLRIRIESMEPEAERVKAVRTIEEASQLLEDILELSRQGRSREPERTIDVAVLVQDIVEDYSETGAPVTLQSSEKSPVACRPVLFGRAMRNLIDNAIAYGGSARVSVLRKGDKVLVTVEDDGPGIPPELLARATDPFVRGESSRSRETGGTGLGLTLADAIAKAHAGSLILANRTPNGLSATIEMPVSGPKPA